MGGGSSKTCAHTLQPAKLDLHRQNYPSLTSPWEGNDATTAARLDLDEREELRATLGWGSLTMGQEKLLSDLAYTTPAVLRRD